MSRSISDVDRTVMCCRRCGVVWDPGPTEYVFDQLPYPVLLQDQLSVPVSQVQYILNLRVTGFIFNPSTRSTIHIIIDPRRQKVQVTGSQ